MANLNERGYPPRQLQPISSNNDHIALARGQPLSDDELRKRIIEQSIRSYPGNCPCPYNLASNGSRCGGRSAYSRPGGHSPLCYARDVSDKRVRQYREQHGLEPPGQ